MIAFWFICFRDFHRLLLGFYWVLLGFPGFSWVFLGLTEFYRALLGFTGFYWVLLGLTGFYWDFTGPSWFCVASRNPLDAVVVLIRDACDDDWSPGVLFLSLAVYANNDVVVTELFLESRAIHSGTETGDVVSLLLFLIRLAERLFWFSLTGKQDQFLYFVIKVRFDSFLRTAWFTD